jgi:hypothetical protein
MKKIISLLSVLVTLAPGAAAQDPPASGATATDSPAPAPHQLHPARKKQMDQDAMHGSVEPGKDAKVFEFAIVRGTLGDDEQTIQVTEGDVVEFRWSSDRELNLHMHGYDMEVDVTPNASAVMRVHAIKTGRFPILNHDGEPPNVLLYLEVQPK